MALLNSLQEVFSSPCLFSFSDTNPFFTRSILKLAEINAKKGNHTLLVIEDVSKNNSPHYLTSLQTNHSSVHLLLDLAPFTTPLATLTGFKDDTRKDYDSLRYQWLLKAGAIKTPPQHNPACAVRHPNLASPHWVRFLLVCPTNKTQKSWEKPDVLAYRKCS
jgi:hypothetical protein